MVNPSRLPPPWVLVLVGLILNILAIVMSSVVLDRLGAQIMTLSEQKNENTYSIQLVWNRIETLERKREVVLLYVSLKGENQVANALQTAFQEQMTLWVGSEVPLITSDNLTRIMAQINQLQQRYRDQIDEYYLKNLSLAEAMMTLNEKIAWYKNIGLFLQVFGLTLILARDLARKPPL
ncbi:DNA mismatch repair protein [Vibrio ostreicida]|uniref:DNA mismatch repair protein n=1 Tax=Vibrio ostreicida TaxID=526588 RepID=A0ABT8C1C3_9VIBR|nr:DNA mismatch repair protein [Vibrio ostreicida]MDN3612143.1 DNA mismatch repair protein [Vibrio ostreicida]NPD08542.1 DNA mismatch repair protein [Vibrio ostreicida]